MDYDWIRFVASLSLSLFSVITSHSSVFVCLDSFFQLVLKTEVLPPHANARTKRAPESRRQSIGNLTAQLYKSHCSFSLVLPSHLHWSVFNIHLLLDHPITPSNSRKEEDNSIRRLQQQQQLVLQGLIKLLKLTDCF